jgi:hypothetical protein
MSLKHKKIDFNHEILAENLEKTIPKGLKN